MVLFHRSLSFSSSSTFSSASLSIHHFEGILSMPCNHTFWSSYLSSSRSPYKDFCQQGHWCPPQPNPQCSRSTFGCWEESGLKEYIDCFDGHCIQIIEAPCAQCTPCKASHPLGLNLWLWCSGQLVQVQRRCAKLLSHTCFAEVHCIERSPSLWIFATVLMTMTTQSSM